MLDAAKQAGGDGGDIHARVMAEKGWPLMAECAEALETVVQVC